MIEARGLTKRYGHQVAVDDLSFTVGPGAVSTAKLMSSLVAM
jgi:ABC-2 type transport system ATP-binding protein